MRATWGILAGLMLRLLLVWSGWCDGGVVADDAYYYFGIARNLASGAGPSFDGLAWTNGFHPLYQLLLVPLFAAGRALGWDAWTCVHGALTLCTICDAITAWLLAAVLRRVGYPRGGVIAAWLWSLSPASLLLTLRGLESSLCALTAVGLLFTLTRDATRPPGSGSGFRLGLALGAAFLARTDSGPLLGAASLVFLLVRARDPAPAGLTWRRVVTGTAGTVAGGALLSFPWVAWNLATFGSPVQVSGLVKLQNRAIFGAFPALSSDDWFLEVARRLSAPLRDLGQYIAGEDQAAPQATYVIWWLMILGLAFATPFLRRTWRAPRGPLDRAMLAFAATVVVLHIALYGFVVGSYAMWYAAVPLLLATLVVGGIAAERLVEPLSARNRRLWCSAAIVLALAVYANFFAHVAHGRQAREREISPVFETIRRAFPQARVVGGFNVGAPGYFAPERWAIRVVNLDGVVNNALYNAWRRGKVLRYLEDNLDLIVMDAPETMKAWLRAGEWEELTRQFPRQGGSLLYGPRRGAVEGLVDGPAGSTPPRGEWTQSPPNARASTPTTSSTSASVSVRGSSRQRPARIVPITGGSAARARRSSSCASRPACSTSTTHPGSFSSGSAPPPTSPCADLRRVSSPGTRAASASAKWRARASRSAGPRRSMASTGTALTARSGSA